jgi:hypothetical protein
MLSVAQQGAPWLISLQVAALLSSLIRGSVDQLLVRWLAAGQVSVLFLAPLHPAGAIHAERT